MIILRYLSRELIISSLSITLVLVVVIMSGDISRYLWEAISGKLDPSVLSAVIAYRIPVFLELILPLGFFVSILMVYGRLYAEQEITVLFSCGVSRRQLVAITYVPALLMASLTAFISLWLAPFGVQQAELIEEQQRARGELDLLQSSRFQMMNQGQFVTYVEEGEANALGELFIASMGVPADQDLTVVRAQSAARIRETDYQQNYLSLVNGTRYDGRPGEADYRVTTFERFAQHLDAPERIEFDIDEIKARPTTALLDSQNLEDIAALQWRISVPLIVFVVTLLGVALSHTTPRRGRYAMIFPSILLYLVYVVVLNAVQGMIAEGRYSPVLGLWSIHLVFLIMGLVLFRLKGGARIGTFFKRAQTRKVTPL